MAARLTEVVTLCEAFLADHDRARLALVAAGWHAERREYLKEVGKDHHRFWSWELEQLAAEAEERAIRRDIDRHWESIEGGSQSS